VLYDPIKNLLTWFKPFQKPVLVCVHGFGVRRSVEFLPLKTYFENFGYQVIVPNLFDQTIEDDNDPKLWIQRVDELVKSLHDNQQEFVLIGFSMGGVIASLLCKRYRAQKLVLLAPAFEYITVKNVSGSAEKKVRTLVRMPAPISTEYPPLPESFTVAFREVVKLSKTSIKDVLCPTLIFHGTQDDVIPLRSSQNAYRRIPHTKKHLFILQDVAHRILDDKIYHREVLAQIQYFIESK